MQHRGETLATIAELAGAGVGELRALLRYAPKAEKPHCGRRTSGALGGAGSRRRAPGCVASPGRRRCGCPALLLVSDRETVTPPARKALMRDRNGYPRPTGGGRVVGSGLACTRLGAVCVRDSTTRPCARTPAARSAPGRCRWSNLRWDLMRSAGRLVLTRACTRAKLRGSQVMWCAARQHRTAYLDLGDRRRRLRPTTWKPARPTRRREATA